MRKETERPFTQVREEIRQKMKSIPGSVSKLCLEMMQCGGTALYYRALARKEWDMLTTAEKHLIMSALDFIEENYKPAYTIEDVKKRASEVLN